MQAARAILESRLLNRSLSSSYLDHTVNPHFAPSSSSTLSSPVYNPHHHQHHQTTNAPSALHVYGPASPTSIPVTDSRYHNGSQPPHSARSNEESPFLLATIMHQQQQSTVDSHFEVPTSILPLQNYFDPVMTKGIPSSSSDKIDENTLRSLTRGEQRPCSSSYRSDSDPTLSTPDSSASSLNTSHNTPSLVGDSSSCSGSRNHSPVPSAASDSSIDEVKDFNLEDLLTSTTINASSSTSDATATTPALDAPITTPIDDSSSKMHGGWAPLTGDAFAIADAFAAAAAVDDMMNMMLVDGSSDDAKKDDLLHNNNNAAASFFDFNLFANSTTPHASAEDDAAAPSSTSAAAADGVTDVLAQLVADYKRQEELVMGNSDDGHARDNVNHQQPPLSTVTLGDVELKGGKLTAPFSAPPSTSIVAAAAAADFSTSVVAGKKRGRTNDASPTPSATATTKDLLPLDAPIQPRKYHGVSATSRKPLPIAVTKTTSSTASAVPDSSARTGQPQEVAAAAPPARKRRSKRDAQAIAEAQLRKRQSNTLAARRSRHKKAEELSLLNETIDGLTAEVEEWKRRFEALQLENQSLRALRR